MSNRIHVATRKGLFTLARKSSDWEIERVDFLGSPVSITMRDPRDGWQYAALTLGHFGTKLHRSPDNGQTWEECGVPVYPQGSVFAVMQGPDAPPSTKPASLTEIWSLEAAGTDQPNLLYAGTIPGGLFRSTDRGSTWQLVESLWNREERMRWFGGGKDEPGIHSVCIHPQDSRRLMVAISCGGVWATEDGGATWECRGSGLRAEYMPPELAYDPVAQDPHRMARCRSKPDALWIQHHNGIFVSSDEARQWTELTDVYPANFGFSVAAHPSDPQTAWFVPAADDSCRVPVDAKLVVNRTRDGGQTFDTLTKGLPQKNCYDIVFRHALDVDGSGERLVMGSTTGGLWISEDAGDSWITFSQTLPPVYCTRFVE